MALCGGSSTNGGEENRICNDFRVVKRRCLRVANALEKYISRKERQLIHRTRGPRRQVVTVSKYTSSPKFKDERDEAIWCQLCSYPS